MKTNDDGGPAFPCDVRVPENYMDERGYGRSRTITLTKGGMSLRDYFAAAALTGLVLNPNIALEASPVHAYELADAMLKARGES